jgi:hypothetical protein
MFGLLDFDKQKNARNSYSAAGNAICFHAYNGGYIYPGTLKTTGGTANVGDTVCMNINRKEKKISWTVG